jgi:hypothetical protein
MTKESFGNSFSKACRAAGVRSVHGLRKIGTTRVAIGKLVNDTGTSIPSPEEKVRTGAEKR